MAYISYITCPCDLPDIYTLALRPAALGVYISGKSLRYMNTEIFLGAAKTLAI